MILSVWFLYFRPSTPINITRYSGEKNISPNLTNSYEPEPEPEPYVFGPSEPEPLEKNEDPEPEPLEKKTRSHLSNEYFCFKRGFVYQI